MKKPLESGSQLTAMNWKLLISIAAVLMAMTGNIFAAAKFVNGLVPDWNQPYYYTVASPNQGPGPDPNHIWQPLSPVDQWNDWCAPTSGANLAGYWADARGIPVADATNFDHSTVLWAAGPSWQDYQADGFARPVPQGAPGSLPIPTTDIGWYMDANQGVLYDAGVGAGTMGGWFFGNGPHAGTYLKDIYAGLQNYLNSRYSLSGSVFWQTGTRGHNFAAGTDPSGVPAVVHPNEASAFAEVKSEINTNRTLILCFTHWNVVNQHINLGSSGTTNMESYYGGTYFTWGPTPGPNPTNAENEVWNYYDNGSALGHAVTAVGYIQGGDADDPGPTMPGLMAPTDWVIVHDNWSTTPRNVIIPYGFPNPPPGNLVPTWVANTTAVPWPTAAKFVKGLVPDWNQPYHYTVNSPNGGPGPDPNNLLPPFSPVDQWNDWCAPTAAANLAGHWTDYHLAPVADTTPFDGSTVTWDGGRHGRITWRMDQPRPAPQGAPGPLPAIANGHRLVHGQQPRRSYLIHRLLE